MDACAGLAEPVAVSQSRWRGQGVHLKRKGSAEQTGGCPCKRREQRVQSVDLCKHGSPGTHSR